jgi:hypothetical protein
MGTQKYIRMSWLRTAQTASEPPADTGKDSSADGSCVHYQARAIAAACVPKAVGREPRFVHDRMPLTLDPPRLGPTAELVLDGVAAGAWPDVHAGVRASVRPRDRMDPVADSVDTYAEQHERIRALYPRVAAISPRNPHKVVSAHNLGFGQPR